MSEINTSESAFPYGDNEFGYISGMTLLDYFAAKAMQSMYLQHFEWEPTGSRRTKEEVHELLELSYDAYEVADCMLRARKAWLS